MKYTRNVPATCRPRATHSRHTQVRGISEASHARMIIGGMDLREVAGTSIALLSVALIIIYRGVLSGQAAGG